MEYENNSSAEAKLVKDFDKVSLVPSKELWWIPLNLAHQRSNSMRKKLRFQWGFDMCRWR